MTATGWTYESAVENALKNANGGPWVVVEHNVCLVRVNQFECVQHTVTLARSECLTTHDEGRGGLTSPASTTEGRGDGRP